MNDIVLTVERLSKSFGGVDAVRDVSFEVAAGELVALIGPNGAGKTTCFNLVNGQLAPDAGTIKLSGTRIDRLPPRAIARMGVGRTFQVAATFASMTVRENVQLALLAHAGGHSSIGARATDLRCTEADALLERVRMTRFARPGLRDARLRRRQARRNRARARRRAAASADGRADRGDVAALARSTDAARRRVSPAMNESPSSSPSTTWTSCSATPTASSCSTTAVSSPKERPTRSARTPTCRGSISARAARPPQSPASVTPRAARIPSARSAIKSAGSSRPIASRRHGPPGSHLVAVCTSSG